MTPGFYLSEEQSRRAYNFMDKKSEDGAPEGAIGGRFTYSFTQTGLGYVVVIKDNISKEELDITEYETW